MGSDSPPPIVTNSTLDVVLVPVILFILGLLTFGFSLERSVSIGLLIRTRYLGYVLVGIGFIRSVSYFFSVVNPSTGAIYRLSLQGKYVEVAHWVTAPFMLVSLGAMYGIERWTAQVIRKQSLE